MHIRKHPYTWIKWFTLNWKPVNKLHANSANVKIETGTAG